MAEFRAAYLADANYVLVANDRALAWFFGSQPTVQIPWDQVEWVHSYADGKCSVTAVSGELIDIEPSLMAPTVNFVIAQVLEHVPSEKIAELPARPPYQVPAATTSRHFTSMASSFDSSSVWAYVFAALCVVGGLRALRSAADSTGSDSLFLLVLGLFGFSVAGGVIWAAHSSQNSGGTRPEAQAALRHGMSAQGPPRNDINVVLADRLGLVVECVNQYPEYIELAKLVKQKNWPGVESLLWNLSHTNPGSLTHAIQNMVGLPAAPSLIRDAKRNSYMAGVASIALGIKQAWDVRPSDGAASSDVAAFQSFWRKLQYAEVELIELAALNPNDTTVACLRLKTALGLGMGVSELRRRYQRVVAHDPHHIAAQEETLISLSPLWYGTADQMLEFVRECADRAPPGSSNARLMADAQIAMWFVPVNDGGGQEFLQRPESYAEIKHAEELTVFHSAYERGVNWIQDHGAFALVHALAGRHEDAAVHFRVLGDLVPCGAWEWFNDRVGKYVEFRDAALRSEAR